MKICKPAKPPEGRALLIFDAVRNILCPGISTTAIPAYRIYKFLSSISRACDDFPDNRKSILLERVGK